MNLALAERGSALDGLVEALCQRWPRIVEHYASLYESRSNPKAGSDCAGLDSQVPVTIQQVIQAVFDEAGPGEIPSAKHPAGDLAELVEKLSLLQRVVLEEMTQVRGPALDRQEIIRIQHALQHLAARAMQDHFLRRQKELAVAVESQNEFLKVLNHELRGDLNAILLTLQVLQRELAQVKEARGSLADLDRIGKLILQTVKKLETIRSNRKK
jgi:signal transduction histidine kinase